MKANERRVKSNEWTPQIMTVIIYFFLNRCRINKNPRRNNEKREGRLTGEVEGEGGKKRKQTITKFVTCGLLGPSQPLEGK